MIFFGNPFKSHVNRERQRKWKTSPLPLIENLEGLQNCLCFSVA